MTALKYYNGSTWVTLPTPAAQEVWSGPDAPVPRGDYRLWIDTDEPDPASQNQNAWQAITYSVATAAVTGWQITPLPTDASYIKTGDAAAFTRNADGSLTVRDAGVYAIAGAVSVGGVTNEIKYAILQKGVSTAANVVADFLCQVGTQVPQAYYPAINFVGYLPAGQVISVVTYCASAQIRQILNFSIARVGTGPQGVPGPPGPGGILSTFLMEGENNGYVGFGAGTNVTVNAAQNKALQWNYVPPVNVWAEVSVNIGLVQKIDGAYHYATLASICTPAPPIGNTASALAFRTQHAAVQQFEPYNYTKLYGLNAGVSYAIYSQWSISGGTWQYHQGAWVTYMSAKVWAR